MRRLAAAASFILFSGCLPAIVHQPLKATPADALGCAARTLASRGYTIVDDDEAGGVIRAQRDRHVSVPFRGSSDVDRIIVSLDHGRDPQMHARGDTIHEGGPGEFSHPRGGSFIGPMSREIYDDTEAVVKNCAGSESS